MLRVLSCITTQHDFRLVLTAVSLCLLACFTTLALHRRAAEMNQGPAKFIWISGAAAVFGCGVWSTHFVAMLAFQSSAPLGYDAGVTFMSLLAAILIGWVGLWIALRGRWLAAIGGAVIGLAVSIMHYLGMAALHTPGLIQWDGQLVSSSVVTGIVFCSIAVFAAAVARSLWQTAIASSLLAFGIAGMHFTAMTAATLEFDPSIPVPQSMMAPEWLAAAVAVVSFLIIAIGLVSWFFDIELADRSRRVAELEVMKKQLERLSTEYQRERDSALKANQAKSEFLASMSHELRTPLNIILGFSDILRLELFGKLGSSQYHGYTEDIHASGSHLLALINDLLDLAKLEAGKTEIREDACDLEHITNSVIHLMQERAHQHGITMVSDCRGSIPFIRGDERKITQILFNLISNAIKFTPQGGHIKVKVAVGANEHVSLSVADTGIGIVAAQIDRVLEPFTQVENVYSRAHPGTGLGLPLSKEIARLHGADFIIRSEVGKGTTVTIVFPEDRLLKGHSPTIEAGHGKGYDTERMESEPFGGYMPARLEMRG